MGEESSATLSLAPEATDPTIVDPRATIRGNGSGSFDESRLTRLERKP